jgi:hypothetical protein
VFVLRTHHARGTGAIVVVTHPPHACVVVVARASLAAGLHAAPVIIIGVIYRRSVRRSSPRVVPSRNAHARGSSLVF